MNLKRDAYREEAPKAFKECQSKSLEWRIAHPIGAKAVAIELHTITTTG